MMPGGVGDGSLIVHWTDNLRVVDACIFLIVTRGNSVYAVAEKAASLINMGSRF